MVEVEENSERSPERKLIETQTTTTYERHGDKSNTMQESYQEKRSFFRSYHLIWYIAGVIDVLIGFRFVFELFGANQYNTFVQLIYTLSYPFAQPFRTIFGSTTVSYSIFDWSLLVAIAVYLLIAFGLVQLLFIIYPISQKEVHHKIHTVS